MISFFTFSQNCPTPENPASLPQGNGFTIPVDKIEVGVKLKVTANPLFTKAIKESIKYHVGYVPSSTFKPTTFFECPPAGCVSSALVDIKNDKEFKIVSIPDFEISFDQPGVYYIIQTYTNVSGYYQCRPIVVYPRPVFDYLTCNCRFVRVSIPNVEANRYWDEIEVEFAANDKQIIKKENYGIEVTNVKEYIGVGTICYSRGQIKVIGRKAITGFTDLITGGSKVDPIDFNGKQDPVNGNGAGGDVKFRITDLIHEANDDVLLKLNKPISAVEISYNGNFDSEYKLIDSRNVIITNGYKDIRVSGLGELPIDKEICFRGAVISSYCGNLPKNLRPVACLTGEIKTITDEIGETSGERDVKVELVSKSQNVADRVVVFRNLGDEAKGRDLRPLGLSSNIYVDNSTLCDEMTYRTVTSLNVSTPEEQNIFSKPKKYKIQSGTLPALDGVGVATVKSLGTAANQMQIDLSFSSKTNGKKYNYYRAPLGSTSFTKINTTPQKQSFFQDSQSNPTDGSFCYYITYQDQCGYESKPTDPICTVFLTSDTPYTTNWTKNEVATNTPISPYVKIIDYTLKEINCEGGNGCVEVAAFTNTKDNVYNMDITDTDPEKVHFKDFWVNVNTEPSLTITSNLIRYYFTPRIFFPNTFTPNTSDNINKDFEFKGLHVNSFSAKIYDRWGGEVFQFNTINDRWDGKISGKDAPEGIYVFKAEAQDFAPEPRKISIKGNFNLIR